jgi:hypothetical protein
MALVAPTPIAMAAMAVMETQGFSAGLARGRPDLAEKRTCLILHSSSSPGRHDAIHPRMSHGLSEVLMRIRDDQEDDVAFASFRSEFFHNPLQLLVRSLFERGADIVERLVQLGDYLGFVGGRVLKVLL